MNKSELRKLARQLGNSGKRGWLTPQGDFFEADETAAVRIAGLELGGHEKAALQYLETNQPDLIEELTAERDAEGFETWEDTDGHDVIKKFMFARGFVRVAAD